MQIWQDIIEKGAADDDGMYLVVEDDCEFLSDFSEANL